MPLDSFIESGAIDLAAMFRTANSAAVASTTSSTVNLGTNSQAIVLDIDAFAEAGIELPAPGLDLGRL